MVSVDILDSLFVGLYVVLLMNWFALDYDSIVQCNVTSHTSKFCASLFILYQNYCIYL